MEPINILALPDQVLCKILIPDTICVHLRDCVPRRVCKRFDKVFRDNIGENIALTVPVGTCLSKPDLVHLQRRFAKEPKTWTVTYYPRFGCTSSMPIFFQVNTQARAYRHLGMNTMPACTQDNAWRFTDIDEEDGKEKDFEFYYIQSIPDTTNWTEEDWDEYRSENA